MTNDGNDDFSDSYLGKLRKKIGHDLVHVPGAGIVSKNLAVKFYYKNDGILGFGIYPGAPQKMARIL
jgi:hypothetical protein